MLVTRKIVLLKKNPYTVFNIPLLFFIPVNSKTIFALMWGKKVLLIPCPIFQPMLLLLKKEVL